MNIIYSASGVLSVFFMILLLSKKQKSLADYILVVWFALILLVIVATYINHNDLSVWQGLFELTDSSVYLHGPIIWFYTLALTEEHFRFRPGDALHLAPFILGASYLFYPLLNDATISDAGRNFVLITKMTLLFIYGAAVLRRLYRHEKNIVNYFSYTEKIKLDWLKLLLWSLMFIWSIGVVSQVVYAYGELEIPQYGGFFTNLAVSLFVLVIGYFGIRQTTIFAPVHLIEKTREVSVSDPLKSDVSEERAKIEDSDLKKKDVFAEKAYQQVLQFMETNKPYLDGQLTLFKLATQLQLSPRQLSKLINQHGDLNFFDFVNQYRVEEVKRKIQADAHMRRTLLAIALDCGFNSKASFNRVFKKINGQTPKEYVKEIRKM